MCVSKIGLFIFGYSPTWNKMAVGIVRSVVNYGMLSCIENKMEYISSE